MNRKKYKITLSDGTVIDNLKLNGNIYISKKELTEDMFVGKLSKVIINDGKTDITYENMTLVHISKHNEEYWFALRPMTERELKDIKIRADIDYLAMMTYVDI